jgi:pimeloyl-ACP methyl ester carboxylesterase
MILMAKLLSIILLIYVSLGLYIYLAQHKLLYLPKIYPLKHAITTAQENGLTLWPTQDTQYQGLLSETTAESPHGTVLFFHGNAGSAMSRTYCSQALNALGYRVILIEYPAYGAKAGSLGESSLVASGTQAVQQAHQQFSAPIYLIAESLGTGVACAVARDTQALIQGLLLITPWDTLPDMAQQRYPMLPTRWLVKDQYNNINNLRHFEHPIGILMAGQDSVIPNSHTKNFIQKLDSNHHVWTFPDVGHTDWISAVNTQWWQQAMAYIASGSQLTQ